MLYPTKAERTTKGTKGDHKKHGAAQPQPNVDDVAVWTELECATFPSSQRRGGCAIKIMPRSHKSGADGREARARQREAVVVVNAAGLRRRAELTTPSATNRKGCIVFDVADSPPLRGFLCPSFFAGHGRNDFVNLRP